jgi:hypothetical protein
MERNLKGNLQAQQPLPMIWRHQAGQLLSQVVVVARPDVGPQGSSAIMDGALADDEMGRDLFSRGHAAGVPDMHFEEAPKAKLVKLAVPEQPGVLVG